jgi:predicted nucleotidyltransferase component of viral defense system
MKMFSPKYSEQLQLLVKTLPYINWNVFSLKGGTAINLFYRPLPRLSVDIDLTFRRISSRETAIAEIHKEMQTTCDRINSDSGFQAIPRKDASLNASPIITKVFVRSNSAEIKIEPNFIVRGSVYDDVSRTIFPETSKLFNINPDLSATVGSFEDVYAGKICAALNRQHPRDLFDIRLLLDDQGITQKTKNAFLIYLCCNNRSVSELLNPNLLNAKNLIETQFSGMSAIPFGFSDYQKTRTELIDLLRNSFSGKDIRFLSTFSAGVPEWNLLRGNIDIDRIQSLPSVQWKLLNISKMEASKRILEADKIKSLFGK